MKGTVVATELRKTVGLFHDSFSLSKRSATNFFLLKLLDYVSLENISVNCEKS